MRKKRHGFLHHFFAIITALVVGSSCVYALLFFLGVPLPSPSKDAQVTKSSSLTSEELSQLMENTAVRIIDARNPRAYSRRHLSGSTNIPLEDLLSIQTLPDTPKGMPIVFVSPIMEAEPFILELFKRRGYTSTHILEHGFRHPGIDSLGLTENEISLEEIVELHMKHTNLQLIDLRSEVEFVDGHLPDAISIPFETFSSKQDGLDPDRITILYCTSDDCTFAEKAWQMLSEDKRWINTDVRIFRGGYRAWKEAGYTLHFG